MFTNRFWYVHVTYDLGKYTNNKNYWICCVSNDINYWMNFPKNKCNNREIYVFKELREAFYKWALICVLHDFLLVDCEIFYAKNYV